jgi:WD40 repeat protein
MMLDNSPMVLSLSYDELLAWNVCQGGSPRRMTVSHDCGEALCSMEGGRVAVASWEEGGATVRVVDVERDDEQILADIHGMTGVCWLGPKEASLFATSNTRGSVHVWDAAHGGVRASMAFNDELRTITAIPDQQLIVAGGQSGLYWLLYDESGGSSQ